MGVLLYDAERIEDAMKVPDESLVESQRRVLLDPHDPKVIEGARKNGISPEFIESAQKSPVWKYVMEWKIALPLHPEYRTMPMLFYVPPLLPVMGRTGSGVYEHEVEDAFASIEKARIPLNFFAGIFSAGNLPIVEEVMRKLVAVRYFQKSKSSAEVSPEKLKKVLRESHLSEKQAQDIYRLTSLCDYQDRFVVPPIQREENLDPSGCQSEACKGSCGFGRNEKPERGA
jgi:nitrate reductase beta subunit